MYHVFARGTGRRVIFEDDADREEFVRRLGMLLQQARGDLHAWCLMGNHYHIVASMQIEQLSMFMKRLNGGYARFFNERHGRTGHLFEARYGSEPITSDAQLLLAVRYVHRNPVEAGLSATCDYPWSSYREYLGTPRFTETSFVLGMYDGETDFAKFHEQKGGEAFLDVSDQRSVARAVTQDEVLARAKSVLGENAFEALPGLPKSERDEHLRRLSQAGLSIRQMELATGVSRGIIQRAVSAHR